MEMTKRILSSRQNCSIVSASFINFFLTNLCMYIHIYALRTCIYSSTRKKEEHSNEVKKLNSEKLERDDRLMEQSKEVSCEIFVHFNSFFAL